MNQTEFENITEDLLISIEDQIYDIDANIDCENAGGILTLTCEQNGSQIIVSRQPALSEIWVAAKSGGFHLTFIANNWFCRVTKESLAELLQRVCLEQSGEQLEFTL